MNSSIQKRTTIKLTVFLSIMIATIYSYTAIAQSANQIKNVGQSVKLVADINPEAKAAPLKESINSSYDELKPTLAPSGNRVYFSRHLHPLNTGGEYDLEDIWYSDFDRTTGTWTDPIRMVGDLNNAGPNYINNVSPTGDTLILGNRYMKKGKMRAGLSYSVNVRGTWSAPMAIDIPNDYNIAESSNTYVSLKAGVIIRAVQRCETYGKRDLYVSFWNGVEATEPVNMGGVINSDLDESSPFIAADNKTLYFASRGHHGYGGYDIYVTRRLDESWTNWSEPENLGPAVNGLLDDEFFSITHCGKFAVFSKQVSVHNADLYKISMTELMGPAESKKGREKQEEREKKIEKDKSMFEDSALSSL
jgi:OmpA-OmpF porin, OOP family